jgi:threonyl-tRNA synthetase
MLQLIAKEPQTYVRYDCSIHEGYEINSLTNQSLKSELLDKFKAKGETEISYYLNVVPVAVLDNARNVTETRQELYREVTKFFQEQGTISSDQAVVFLDLCAGPHVSLTKEDLEPLGVKLEKLAGAYRQADEDNAMMTRVYGLCFESKQALKDYEHMMEEARKRDHRKL